MARTILQDRVALVLGVETALGRACAQQFSRAGCRIVMASQDPVRLDTLIEQLLKKGGNPTALLLSASEEHWPGQIRTARDQLGHIHVVVNAMAFAYASDEQAAARAEQAQRLDRVCADLLVGHGPAKLLTLWPRELPVPAPITDAAWHSHVVLGPRQRLDSEEVPVLDAGGTMHLRAGAVADAVVFLAQLPPSARPTAVHLDAIPSAEKKAGK